eukprot:jgi/Ulvmu1/5511/UM023_0047.1
MPQSSRTHCVPQREQGCAPRRLLNLGCLKDGSATLRYGRAATVASRRAWRSVECNATDPDDKVKPPGRGMEDELRDPKYFLEYFLPRPLRLVFFAASGLGCLIALLLGIAQISAEGTQAAAADGTLTNLAINGGGLATFLGLFVWDRKQAEVRLEQRTQLRQAQIKFGDREVFYNDEGEKMSRLKEVDDEWIVRRLERWGRRDNMPFLGPDKSTLLQAVVRARQPRCVVEVGGMCGYSGIKIAQALPPGGVVISIEKDWLWALTAQRFLWQCSGGSRNTDLRRQGLTPIGKRVQVKWGDALQVLPRLQLPEGCAGIDVLLLDGVPRETLAYLRAAEPLLSDGAVVVADNAGVFKDGGMKEYLAYVRDSPQYDSEFRESYFEWRDDVPDGLEVSTYSAGAPDAPKAEAGTAVGEAAASEVA